MCCGRFFRSVAWLLRDVLYIGCIIRWLFRSGTRNVKSGKRSPEPRYSIESQPISRKSSTDDENVGKPQRSRTVDQTKSQLNRKILDFSSNSQFQESNPGPSRRTTAFQTPISIPDQMPKRRKDSVSNSSFDTRIERVRSEEDLQNVQHEMENSLKRQENEETSRKRLEEQKREYDEYCRRVNEEINECKVETQRLLYERNRYLKMCREARHICFLAEEKFRMKEEEWSKYLKSMQDTITNLRKHAVFSAKIYRQLNPADGNYEEILVNELDHLHKATLQVNDQFYKECLATKNLAITYPARLFLRILWKKLVDVQGKLFHILNGIDVSKRTKSSVDQVLPLFVQLKPRDIPRTDELRLLEKTESPENYQIIDEPQYYEER